MFTRTTFHPDGVREVTELICGDPHRHSLFGPGSAVEEHTKRLERQYPPEGYGTRVRYGKYFPDGTVHVIVDHARSCD